MSVAIISKASRYPVQSSDLPLAWLGVYRDPIVFDHEQGRILNNIVLPEPGDNGHAIPDALANTVSLQLPQADYISKVRRIKDYIAARDTYQVNFTDRVEISVPDNSIEAFQSLLRHQPVAYRQRLPQPDGLPDSVALARAVLSRRSRQNCYPADEGHNAART